jgi:hypothetical protein
MFDTLQHGPLPAAGNPARRSDIDCVERRVRSWRIELTCDKLDRNGRATFLSGLRQQWIGQRWWPNIGNM